MLPKHLHKYFWDTDAKAVDAKKDRYYIIWKLLEHGDLKDLKWMFKTFPLGLIKKVFMTRRGFSPRVVNFWHLFFGIPKNKILCLNKSFQKRRKTHWPY